MGFLGMLKGASKENLQGSSRSPSKSPSKSRPTSEQKSLKAGKDGIYNGDIVQRMKDQQASDKKKNVMSKAMLGTSHMLNIFTGSRNAQASKEVADAELKASENLRNMSSPRDTMIIDRGKMTDEGLSPVKVGRTGKVEPAPPPPPGPPEDPYFYVKEGYQPPDWVLTAATPSPDKRQAGAMCRGWHDYSKGENCKITNVIEHGFRNNKMFIAN